ESAYLLAESYPAAYIVWHFDVPISLWTNGALAMARTAWVVIGVCVLSCPVRADDPPQMKFNDVKEVAPGVFFRYSSIGPEGSAIPFGGCNNIWVVYEDYVVVIDANFPKEAKDVIAAVRKTTDKPIRYVLDTHHHGDHAYGNDEFGKIGASIIAQ